MDTLPSPAPVVSTPANGAITNTSQPAVTGTATTNLTVTVYLDGVSSGTTTADGSGSWSFTPAAPPSDGAHTAKATATDSANNTSVDSNSITFIIDTTAPNTSITSTLPTLTNSITATFEFTATDVISGGVTTGIAGFACQLDGSGFSPCASPLVLTSLGDGSHTCEVRALDGAGNTDATPARYRWSIDSALVQVSVAQASGQADPATTAPISFSVTFDPSIPSVLSIVRADPSPTNAPTVTFSVTFSEAVANVD